MQQEILYWRSYLGKQGGTIVGAYLGGGWQHRVSHWHTAHRGESLTHNTKYETQHISQNTQNTTQNTHHKIQNTTHKKQHTAHSCTGEKMCHHNPGEPLSSSPLLKLGQHCQLSSLSASSLAHFEIILGMKGCLAPISLSHSSYGSYMSNIYSYSHSSLSVLTSLKDSKGPLACFWTFVTMMIRNIQNCQHKWLENWTGIEIAGDTAAAAVEVVTLGVQRSARSEREVELFGLPTYAKVNSRVHLFGE